MPFTLPITSFPTVYIPLTSFWFRRPVPFPWISKPLTSVSRLYYKVGLDDIFKENNSNYVIYTVRLFSRTSHYHIECDFFIMIFKTFLKDLSNYLLLWSGHVQCHSQLAILPDIYTWQKLPLLTPLLFCFSYLEYHLSLSPFWNPVHP